MQQVSGDVSSWPSGLSQAATSATADANKAVLGAGITCADTGELYLGFMPDGTESTLTGGVCGNYSRTTSDYPSMTVMAGEIQSDGVLMISSGNISFNSTAGDVAGIQNNGTFTMNGGLIERNESQNSSGGIRNLKTFSISGGTIKNNTVATDGGAVYNTGANAAFSMSASAYIPFGVNGVKGAGKNDVYLYTGASNSVLTPQFPGQYRNLTTCTQTIQFL